MYRDMEATALGCIMGVWKDEEEADKPTALEKTENGTLHAAANVQKVAHILRSLE